MPVYTFNPLEHPRWAEFGEQHPRFSVFHTTGWLEALRRTYGYEPIVYTTSPPGSILTNGIVFCRVSSWLTGRRLVSLPFADHCEPLVERPEEREEIFGALQRTFGQEKLKYIEIRPRNAELTAGSGIRKSDLFCFHSLDLRPALADLFGRFQKDSTQRKIRRAEREGLFYEAGRSQALLNEFYRLSFLTRQRHKLPPQPIEWFQNLIACLGDRLRIHVAFNGEQAIASILTLRHGRTLVYKYGCSDANFHKLGGMPLLFWKAIQEAKEQGLEELDFGRSDSDNAGLIAFKGHFGAAESELTYVRWCAPHRRSLTEGYGMKIAKRLVGHMPSGLLTTAGRILYKHVG
jgi:CelD/BcsL family acetyltransferase involved in cellulose biosynthesis